MSAWTRIQEILSAFSPLFIRDGFQYFEQFVLTFARAGKDGHHAARVKGHSIFRRALSGFADFLSQARWDAPTVCVQMIETSCQVDKVRPGNTVLYIHDSTVTEKEHARTMEGRDTFYDHAKKTTVFGHRWEVGALLLKRLFSPVWIEPYLKRFPHGDRTKKACRDYRSKIQILIETLLEVGGLLPEGAIKIALADAEYFARRVASWCREHGWVFVSQLKKNAVVIWEGKKIRIDRLARKWSHFHRIKTTLYGHGQMVRYAKFIVELPRFGLVAVVVVKLEGRRTHYLVSTDPSWSAFKILKTYEKRNRIEQVIKDLKQRFGLGEYQAQTMKAIHRHAVVSVAAYWALAVLGLLCSVKRKLQSFNGSPLRFLRSLLRKLLIARKQWIIARKNGWNVTLEDLFQSLTHVDL